MLFYNFEKYSQVWMPMGSFELFTNSKLVNNYSD